MGHVPREQNARADLLAKLASSGKGGLVEDRHTRNFEDTSGFCRRSPGLSHLQVDGKDGEEP